MTAARKAYRAVVGCWDTLRRANAVVVVETDEDHITVSSPELYTMTRAECAQLRFALASADAHAALTDPAAVRRAEQRRWAVIGESLDGVSDSPLIVGVHLARRRITLEHVPPVVYLSPRAAHALRQALADAAALVLNDG